MQNDVAVIGFNSVPPTQLRMATINVTHANFELTSQPGASITNFTLAQVLAQQVHFIHDGGTIEPSFSLIISDGTNTRGPFVANIFFQQTNHPPILGNHFIRINEGQSYLLSLANFNATDDETPTTLQFITSQQGLSQFEHVSQPNVVVTRFSQVDVNNGYIVFKHIVDTQNSDLLPFCRVAVSDGQLESPAVPIQFDFNAAPKFLQNQMSIYRGQVLTLSFNELRAIDRDDPAVNLTFIMSEVVSGSFTKNRFIQGELEQGLITFQHDGSDQAPAYKVSIQDKRMTIPPQAALVIFTDKNPNAVLDAAGIAGTAVGGGIALGLVVGGIFAYRNYRRNRDSRKTHPYEDAVYKTLKPMGAANFNSSGGRSFVQALHNLKGELSRQGINVDQMGAWELNQLANQITLAIQAEINHKKNGRGESEIDGQMIQSHLANIAVAVQKIRVGGYQAGVL